MVRAQRLTVGQSGAQSQSSGARLPFIRLNCQRRREWASPKAIAERWLHILHKDTRNSRGLVRKRLQRALRRRRMAKTFVATATTAAVHTVLSNTTRHDRSVDRKSRPGFTVALIARPQNAHQPRGHNTPASRSIAHSKGPLVAACWKRRQIRPGGVRLNVASERASVNCFITDAARSIGAEAISRVTLSEEPACLCEYEWLALETDTSERVRREEAEEEEEGKTNRRCELAAPLVLIGCSLEACL